MRNKRYIEKGIENIEEVKVNYVTASTEEEAKELRQLMLSDKKVMNEKAVWIRKHALKPDLEETIFSLDENAAKTTKCLMSFSIISLRKNMLMKRLLIIWQVVVFLLL